MSKNDLLNIIFLIFYNIFISKIFNDSCFSIVNKFPSFFIAISYIVTLYIYYKLLIGKINSDDMISKLFIIFIYLILFISIILSINNSNYSSKTYFNGLLTPYIITILSFSLIVALGIIVLSFNKNENSEINNNEMQKYIQITKHSLFIVFVILFIYFIINWFIILFKTFKTNSIFKTLIIIGILITLFAIIFKMISYTSFYKNNLQVQLIINLFFYIPCLFIGVIDKITNIYKSNSNLIKNVNYNNYLNYNKTDIILLIIAIILYIVYFNYNILYIKYSSQGGTQLLTEPYYLNNKKVLASYSSLVLNTDKKSKENIQNNIEIIKSDENIHSFNYGLSCWIFIDSNNLTSRSNDYCSIINYGHKPNIQYKANNNSLIITIDNKNLDNEQNETKLKKLDNIGHLIIYEYDKLLLQKWNNIIINYESGILDIFINGELIQSLKQFIPYMTMDNITIGEEDGIQGGICNVIYFKNGLNIKQINNIYNSVKDLNPPVPLTYFNKLYLNSLKIENLTKMLGLNYINN
jgi:hypothetical protein